MLLDGGIGDLIAQEVTRAREKAEEEKRAKHVRPWDRGKSVWDVVYTVYS